MKREWVRSYVEGRRGIELLAAGTDGFLAVLEAPDGARVIDLVGVAQAAQGRGRRRGARRRVRQPAWRGRAHAARRHAGRERAFAPPVREARLPDRRLRRTSSTATWASDADRRVRHRRARSRDRRDREQPRRRRRRRARARRARRRRRRGRGQVPDVPSRSTTSPPARCRALRAPERFRALLRRVRGARRAGARARAAVHLDALRPRERSVPGPCRRCDQDRVRATTLRAVARSRGGNSPADARVRRARGARSIRRAVRAHSRESGQGTIPASRSSIASRLTRCRRRRLNLRAIATLAAELDCAIGYSDHTVGVDAAPLAVALGARVIEKHFTLDKRYSDFRDHELSADPPELAELVRRVRLAETLLGTATKEVQPSERPGVVALRRSICALRDLPVGHVVTAEDLTWVRPGGGLRPGEEDVLLGRRLRRAVSAGEQLGVADTE